NVRQVVGKRAIDIDVFDQEGAGGSAVARPQLNPVRVVVSREEQGPINVGQIGVFENAVGGAGVNVIDHEGAGGAAIALAEFEPVGAVVSGEEEDAVHVRQIGVFAEKNAVGGAGVNVIDHEGAGGAAIALP